jgi:hypothetical protein
MENVCTNSLPSALHVRIGKTIWLENKKNMELEKQARDLEKESRWEEAAKMWRLCRRYEDADACQMIADATEKGDDYRRDVTLTIGQEPELTSSTTHVWQKWHSDLAVIYNKHFR